MKSYIDAEQTTYDSVISQPLRLLAGKPTWRMKEELKNEAGRIAVKYKVSYDWSGGRGLLALVIGAARLHADYPLLPAYVQPVQPATIPAGLPARPTPAQLREANDAVDILNRDWAVVSGFKRGMCELIRLAVDAEYYEDLSHHVYGYDDIWPIDHFDEIDTHVPLDEPAKKECRDHYLRGWQLSSAKPETIIKFRRRLNEEQAALLRDGITITNADKLEHYLLQIYRSGKYHIQTIQTWKKEAVQDWPAATAYFETEDIGLKEAHRLTGDTPGSHGFGSINAAMEENMDKLLEKINSSVEERVNASIQQAISQVSRKHEEANAAAQAELKTQVYDLKSTVYQLRDQIQKLSANINTGGNENQNPNTNGPGPTNKHMNPKHVHGFGDNQVTWTTGLLYSDNWSKRKKSNYESVYKRMEPEGYKTWKRARIVATQERQLANLE